MMTYCFMFEGQLRMSKQPKFDPRAGDSSSGSSEILEVCDLTKIYNDEILAVDDISFSIDEGDYCVIIGPSGCGKSTTLHSLVGKLNLTSGDVTLNDTNITDVPTYNRDIGLVFQDFQLFPNLTVEENIRYGLERVEETGPKAEEAVEEMLRLLNINEVRDRYPKEISAGQKQRCALGRGLVLNPSLMLLDEPLGDLDYRLQKELETELLRIHHDTDITFVHVTHDQRQAMRLADQIVVMNDGKIEQSGSVKEIYQEPATAFVAAFVGDSNITNGSIETVSQDGERVKVETNYGIFSATTDNLISDPEELHHETISFAIRPDSLKLTEEADNTLTCKVEDVLYQPGGGTQCILHATGTDGEELEIQLKSKSKLEIEEGSTTTVGWDAEDMILLETVSVVPDTDLEKDILGT